MRERPARRFDAVARRLVRVVGPRGGVLALLMSMAIAVAIGSSTAAHSGSADPLVSVIVQFDSPPLARYTGEVAGLAATSPAVTGERRMEARSGAAQAYAAFLQRRERDFASALSTAMPGARVVHRFRSVIGGASLLVPRSQVGRLASLPGVTTVYPDPRRELQTDRSPSFIRATELWWIVGGPSTAGEGVVVGVIDSGIWPEHPSYSDPDLSGKHYRRPPGSWTGDACEFGSAVPGDEPFTCNSKLIGARRLMATYDAAVGLLPTEFPSARDDNGHGTHTSSTAAGNRGVNASIFGVRRGVVSGIAPRAHVAAYKACGDEGCFTSDLVAAINQAVEDGVDVINYSIGSTVPGDPYTDADSLAFLDAYAAGVFVAVSAGNSGPDPNTIGSPANAPWVTSVAASTSDRAFRSAVRLRGSDGATLALTGMTITRGIGTRPVVRGQDFGDVFCENPFPAGTFSGQIVACQRGGAGARVSKSFNVAAGGAGGMLLYNVLPQDVLTDNHFVPSVHLDQAAGASLLGFLAAHPGVTGSFTAGAAAGRQGDVMAFFSSRGGPDQGLLTIKPDVAAPGLQILAGNTPLPATLEGGLPGQLFQAIAGTSMSSPHVAGLGALLTQLHPAWTPGRIRSALMTSAVQGVLKETGVGPANPFDTGSGRADGRSWKTVLTLDASAQSFFDHASDPWNINLPSLYLPALTGSVTVARTLHSDLLLASQWRIEGVGAPGLSVSASPGVVTVPAQGDATVQIRVDASTAPPGVHFGAITLRRLFLGRFPTGESLRLPVAVAKP